MASFSYPEGATREILWKREYRNGHKKISDVVLWPYWGISGCQSSTYPKRLINPCVTKTDPSGLFTTVRYTTSENCVTISRQRAMPLSPSLTPRWSFTLTRSGGRTVSRDSAGCSLSASGITRRDTFFWHGIVSVRNRFVIIKGTAR